MRHTNSSAVANARVAARVPGDASSCQENSSILEGEASKSNACCTLQWRQWPYMRTSELILNAVLLNMTQARNFFLFLIHESARKKVAFWGQRRWRERKAKRALALVFDSRNRAAKNIQRQFR